MLFRNSLVHLLIYLDVCFLVVCLKPTFEISVHAFDYDSVGGDDDLGVTSYTHSGNTNTHETVTTIPDKKNLR